MISSADGDPASPSLAYKVLGADGKVLYESVLMGEGEPGGEGER